MFKKFIAAIIIAILLFGSGVSAKENTILDKINKLVYYMEGGKLDKYLQVKKPDWMGVREKIAVGEYSIDYKWEIHYAEIDFHGAHGNNLFIAVRHYQNYTSPGHGFEVWEFIDRGRDGIIDVCKRDYKIVVKDVFVDPAPHWPKGIFNKDWFVPSREEINKVFEKELDYWLLKVEKK